MFLMYIKIMYINLLWYLIYFVTACRTAIAVRLVDSKYNLLNGYYYLKLIMSIYNNEAFDKNTIWSKSAD